MPKILDQKKLRAAGAYTTSLSGDTDQNFGFRGIVVTTNITNAGSGSLTVNIYQVDANGIDRLILSATYTSTGLKVLRVMPTLTAVANVDAQDEIPNNFRVDLIHNNANSMTYSSAYSMVV